MLFFTHPEKFGVDGILGVATLERKIFFLWWQCEVIHCFPYPCIHDGLFYVDVEANTSAITAQEKSFIKRGKEYFDPVSGPPLTVLRPSNRPKKPTVNPVVQFVPRKAKKPCWSGARVVLGI